MNDTNEMRDYRRLVKMFGDSRGISRLRTATPEDVLDVDRAAYLLRTLRWEIEESIESDTMDRAEQAVATVAERADYLRAKRA